MAGECEAMDFYSVISRNSPQGLNMTNVCQTHHQWRTPLLPCWNAFSSPFDANSVGVELIISYLRSILNKFALVAVWLSFYSLKPFSSFTLPNFSNSSLTMGGFCCVWYDLSNVKSFCRELCDFILLLLPIFCIMNGEIIKQPTYMHTLLIFTFKMHLCLRPKLLKKQFWNMYCSHEIAFVF